MKLALALTFIMAIVFTLPHYPNIWMLFMATLFAFAAFLMAKTFKHDTKLERYVESANVWKLLFILLPGVLFCALLSALTLWGVYFHLSNGDLSGATEIVKTSPGKGLPTGSYSNSTLLVGISCMFVFFTTINFYVLRAVMLGLKYRLGFAKRAPKQYDTTNTLSKKLKFKKSKK